MLNPCNDIVVIIFKQIRLAKKSETQPSGATEESGTDKPLYDFQKTDKLFKQIFH